MRGYLAEHLGVFDPEDTRILVAALDKAQTRPIEGRHLPACRDRPGHAGHAAERRSSQNHSTAGHARRRSKCAAEVASRVRCRIHERSAQSSALDDSRLGAPLSLLTCDDCGA